MARSVAWKQMERQVASDFNAAIKDPEVTVKRNIGSGAINRRDNGSPRPGDVVLPPYFDALVECKAYARHAHHTLYKDAKADAKKHGISKAILCTKTKGDHGYLITIDSELFMAMLAVPEVQKLFHK